MKKAILIFLLGILIAGCGMGNKEAGNQSKSGNNSGIAAGEMVPSLEEKSPLLFEYTVKNQTEKESLLISLALRDLIIQCMIVVEKRYIYSQVLLAIFKRLAKRLLNKVKN